MGKTRKKPELIDGCIVDPSPPSDTQPDGDADTVEQCCELEPDLALELHADETLRKYHGPYVSQQSGNGLSPDH